MNFYWFWHSSCRHKQKHGHTQTLSCGHTRTPTICLVTLWAHFQHVVERESDAWITTTRWIERKPQPRPLRQKRNEHNTKFVANSRINFVFYVDVFATLLATTLFWMRLRSQVIVVAIARYLFTFMCWDRTRSLALSISAWVRWRSHRSRKLVCHAQAHSLILSALSPCLSCAVRIEAAAAAAQQQQLRLIGLFCVWTSSSSFAAFKADGGPQLSSFPLSVCVCLCTCACAVAKFN